MASQGLLTIDSAIPILFGDNIGTTITAVLASVGLNRSARQSALAHVLFKVIGVLLFLAFLGPFRQLVLLTSTDIARQLANAHTIFNVLNTLLFLPFVETLCSPREGYYPRCRGGDTYGSPFSGQEPDIGLANSRLEAVRKELVRLGLLALDMIRDVRTAFLENDRRMIEQVLQTERVVNELTGRSRPFRRT
jgi:phosphate:Na+ symporter